MTQITQLGVDDYRAVAIPAAEFEGLIKVGIQRHKAFRSLKTVTRITAPALPLDDAQFLSEGVCHDITKQPGPHR